MGRVQTALYLALEMLCFVPLAVFCFIPVWDYIRNSPGKLAAKVAVTVIVTEFLFFLLFLASPTIEASNVGQLFLGIAMFLLYCQEVRLPPWRLLFIFLTACLIGGYSYLIYHITDILLYPEGSYEMLYKPYSFCAQLIFECLFIAVFFIPARKYLGWLMSNYHEERIWRSVWVFPAVFTVFSYFFVPYNNSYMYLGRFMKMYFVFLLLSFVIVLTLYVLFYEFAVTMTEKSELLERSAYLEVQVQQFEELQNHVQETRRLRHDFRHHLTAISEMLEHGHYGEALEFLREYRSDIPDMPKQYCGSTAVNAVLHHYASAYRSEKIQAEFDIRISPELPVDDIDFCVLLGNLLENALHGCREVHEENRKIELRMVQTTPHIAVIQICNSFSGTVKRENGRFLSSKHPGTGQGLHSVRMIVKKYRGEVTVTDEKQMFIVRILLNF